MTRQQRLGHGVGGAGGVSRAGGMVPGAAEEAAEVGSQGMVPGFAFGEVHSSCGVLDFHRETVSH